MLSAKCDITKTMGIIQTGLDQVAFRCACGVTKGESEIIQHSFFVYETKESVCVYWTKINLIV